MGAVLSTHSGIRLYTMGEQIHCSEFKNLEQLILRA
jgi:hypothetical protein